MDPLSAIAHACELTKIIIEKFEEAKRNRSSARALAKDVADAHARLLEVQDMARRNAKVLQAIERVVRDLHGLVVEIDALAERIRTAPMWRRLCSSGDHKQETSGSSCGCSCSFSWAQQA
jgi:hypothetical protein